MNIVKFREILKERIRISVETQDNWDYGIEKCWVQMTEVLSEDIDGTITFLLEDCTADEFIWISEIFEEVTEKTHSRAFISTLVAVAEKYSDEIKEYNVVNVIGYAEALLNDCSK
jgi:hypothetical protein